MRRREWRWHISGGVQIQSLQIHVENQSYSLSTEALECIFGIHELGQGFTVGRIADQLLPHKSFAYS
jgi:hypothetical protein